MKGIVTRQGDVLTLLNARNHAHILRYFGIKDEGNLISERMWVAVKLEENRVLIAPGQEIPSWWEDVINIVTERCLQTKEG